MPFRPARTASGFADLKTTLAQSQGGDDAMYQTVETLIDRLDDVVGGGTRRILVGGTGGGGNGGGSGGGMNLDYLGQFASGPTYNDGDIVIGPNNVLYMCVVDGTTSAPEIWPGIGVAEGSGTPGKVVKWISTLTLGDSVITETGNVVIVAGTFGTTGLNVAGSVIYSNGTVFAATGLGIPRAGLAPFLRGHNTAAPEWTSVQYPDYPGIDGQFIIAKSGDWYNSLLQLPYTTLGNGGLVYAVAANQWGQSTTLTFDGTTLTATNIAITGYIGSPNYTSQTTGWRIDSTTGGADFRYLYTDTMMAKSFVNDLEQSLVGGQIISKSVVLLAVAFIAPALGATAQMRLRDIPSAPNMAAFESGDMVIARMFSRASGLLTISECVGYVTAYADQSDGTQTWTFNRNTGTDGGNMAAGVVVPIDALIIDYGRTGNGYYEVSAVDGAYGINSPYAQIVTWTVAPVSAHKVLRTRFGNLYGITGTADEFGMLAGTYSGTGGQYFRASNSKFELHGIDLYLWDGAVNTVKLSHNIPSFALGSPIPIAFLGTNPGIWMGKDVDGIYKFRVGDPSQSYAAWDGSIYKIVGAIHALSGDITGDFVVGTGGQIRSGATDFTTGTGWWLDYHGGAPRFRVGNPGGDRLVWDGVAGLTVKSGLLTIDGSYGGRVGIGALPYSIATLNVAALNNTKNSMSLFCTGTLGGMSNTSLICYGDGSIFLGHEIHIIAGSWSLTGAGTNPGLQANGPFGYNQPGGWMRIFIDVGTGEQQGWIPIWLG